MSNIYDKPQCKNGLYRLTRLILVLFATVVTVSALVQPSISYAATCPAGAYWDGTTCIPASPGSYVLPLRVAATSATLCPVGAYQDLAGQSSCKLAPKGSYIDIFGAITATAAKLCPMGAYQDLTGQSSCKPAPAGSYVAVTGAGAPSLCLVANREYQDQEGQTSCKSAGVFGTVADDGATKPICAVDYYYSKGGEFSCLLCPKGATCKYSGIELSTPVAPTTRP